MSMLLLGFKFSDNLYQLVDSDVTMQLCCMFIDHLSYILSLYMQCCIIIQTMCMDETEFCRHMLPHHIFEYLQAGGMCLAKLTKSDSTL